MVQITGVHTDLVGEIKTWSGAVAPANHLICDGSPISRTSYPALFNKIGTTYGTGNGSTTFNLPDFRAQFLRGTVSSSLNSIVGSGTVNTNTATFSNHGLNRTGFKVRFLSGTLSGLATLTDYYAIVIDSNTLAFATTRALALAGTKVAITGANSGVIGQYEDPDNSTRVAHNSGASSSGVGTIQEDQVASHSHLLSNTDISTGAASGGVGRPQQSGTSQTGLFGGNETRTKNAYVNYIIKAL
ncbi:Phage tail collar domain containing protein [uncultured Caudovirales phage]|uniref:Phage tail collar domain containing protein n=1 Tax=uncultured Caudovirales phage TaxID=2100421 RepID=A0A6J5KX49_9CAUD|nr:Phage tail collar domain containing protein [uncultured Caudovirales phage]